MDDIRKLLKTLSTDSINNIEDEVIAEGLLDGYASSFKTIYDKGYRQRYSEILDILKDIDSSYDADESSNDSYNQDGVGSQGSEDDHLAILSENLTCLREYTRKNIKRFGEPTFYGITKLSDHVDIEIHRYREIQNLEYHLTNNDYDLDEVVSRINDLNIKLRKANDMVEKTAGNANRLQIEMVTILGIFATIVIAFSGGLSIISDAVSSSGNVPIFESVYVILLCAIVVFNVIAFLMLTIMRITDKDRDRSRLRPMKFKMRVRRNVLNNGYIISFNIVLIAMLAIDGILWYIIG